MTRHTGSVALVGRPNVGKSSLLNRLLGQKLAITSHKPQTTRHRIIGIDTHPEGQIIFLDTPGIHQRKGDALNRMLNRTARSSMLEADLLLWVVEAGVWTEEDQLAGKAIADSGIPFLVAVNKIDRLVPRDRLLPILQQIQQVTGSDQLIPCSAQTGDNIELLREQLFRRLPEGEPIFPGDQLSDRPQRFFVAELIREQIIRRYHKELPYSVSVEVEHYVEEPGLVRIAALIWVEREGQKAILLGKNGEALKAAATESRQALEAFLDSKVFLKLWIKVRKNWSSSEAALSQLGYRDE